MIRMKKINKTSFKYGSYAFIVTAVVMAILFVLNAVLGLDNVRDRLRLDITENKKFSISQTSDDILKSLSKDVEIIILTEEKNFNQPMIPEVLKQYNIKSNGKIKVRYVDVEKDPTFVERELDSEQVKGITRDSIVVKSGKKNKVITENDLVEYDYSNGYSPQVSGLKIEQAFTSAVKSVTSDFTPVLYYSKGHGEISLDEELSDLKATIAANNYEIKELNLAQTIPEDASLVLFASPQSDLLPKEMDNLLEFMGKGGDAIFLMGVQNSVKPLDNFNLVFERYSLKLNNDYVLEGDQSRYYREFNIIIPQPIKNEVTENLDPDSLSLYMPNCRSVTISQATKEWINSQPLFATSEKSQSTDFETQTASPGPFLLGAISEYKGQNSSKIALVGNIEFVSNTLMQNLSDNGKRYILSMLNWMLDQKESLYIPSKSLASQPLNFNEQSMFITFILLALVLPLAIIGFGVFIWLRRKHL